MITLQFLQTEINKRFPGLELVKNSEGGSAYFYLHSNNDDLALQLAGLYTTSIYQTGVNKLTVDQWMKEIAFVLEDNHRPVYERTPVKIAILTIHDIAKASNPNGTFVMYLGERFQVAHIDYITDRVDLIEIGVNEAPMVPQIKAEDLTLVK